MLNKAETLQVLINAKNEYNSHIYKIKNISNINSDTQKGINKNKESYILGKWLYENKDQAKDMLGGLFYTELEALHSTFIEDLLKVYDIYKEQDKGIMSMFRKKEMSIQNKDKVSAYYDDLLRTEESLKVMLNKICLRLNALSESKFI